MIETKIYLINFENKLTDDFGNNLGNTREGFVCWKGRKVFTRDLL